MKKVLANKTTPKLKPGKVAIAGVEVVNRGRGRPTTEFKLANQLLRESAMMTGELPHEFLLRVSRGDAIDQMVLAEPRVRGEDGKWTVAKWARVTIYPDFPTRIDVAKAAANYFAAKLSTVEVIERASEDELDAFIRSIAAEAGFSLGASGEGPTGRSDPPESGLAAFNPDAPVH